MTSNKILKQLLHPLRNVLGRFAISPWEERVAALEAKVYELQLNNTIVYKAASFIAADKIEGDYLEFGVFRGGSFVTAYISLLEAFNRASTPGIWNTEQDCVERSALWNRMRFFAFDSFEGLPTPSGVDAQSRDFVEGKFSCTEDEFKKIISARGVPLDKVTTVPGWFNESLNRDTLEKHNIRKAAVVYVDCDLYESAKSVLDFITPLLVDGSIIIFDDWYNFNGDPDLGEQKAYGEWLKMHPDIKLTQYHKEGPWKNSFIVHKAAK
jgi:hypothetical protein